MTRFDSPGLTPDWTMKRATGSNWICGQSGARCKIAAVPKKARENLQQVLRLGWSNYPTLSRRITDM
jgi:hypothetical protein